MYEIGVGVAFLCWVAGNVIWIAERNSIRARNLRRIGFRIGLLGEVVPLTGHDLRRPWIVRALRLTLVLFIGWILTFTSWLYVAAYAGGIAWNLSKRAGAPAAVRELAWRMRNVDMQLDEIVLHTMRSKGIADDKFEETKEALIAEMREREVI